MIIKRYVCVYLSLWGEERGTACVGGIFNVYFNGCSTHSLGGSCLVKMRMRD